MVKDVPDAVCDGRHLMDRAPLDEYQVRYMTALTHETFYVQRSAVLEPATPEQLDAALQGFVSQSVMSRDEYQRRYLNTITQQRTGEVSFPLHPADEDFLSRETWTAEERAAHRQRERFAQHPTRPCKKDKYCCLPVGHSGAHFTKNELEWERTGEATG